MDNQADLLGEKLRHSFGNQALLSEALRHRSYVNEQHDPQLNDNEKLEFLGDAVVNLVVGHLLMDRWPRYNEGELSRVRASLVNEEQLATIARRIDLGSHILLGRGELNSGGREKDSILADCLEAVIAAVYLDAGFQTAFRVIKRLFEPWLKKAAPTQGGRDHKSKLQEIAQEKLRQIPAYRIVAENGPDHAKVFQAQVEVADIKATGTGKSKKAAQQDAAAKALKLLGKTVSGT